MPEEQSTAQQSTQSMEDESPVIQADSALRTALHSGAYAVLGALALAVLL